MIRKNSLLISVVFVLTLFSSFFLYKNVAETSYLVRHEISLTRNGKKLRGMGPENQRFLRILKQQDIRSTLINENNLVSKFDIDTTHKNGLYQLDKALIDHLKVEEHKKGAIQIRFISESTAFSRKILIHLTDLALSQLNSELEEPVKSHIVFEKTKTLEPKFLSILFLVSAPVMLFLVIFIAVKQKLYLGLLDE